MIIEKIYTTEDAECRKYCDICDILVIERY